MVSKKQRELHEALLRAMSRESKPSANHLIDEFTRPTEKSLPRDNPDYIKEATGQSETFHRAVNRWKAMQPGTVAPPIPNKVPKALSWEKFTFGEVTRSDTDDKDRLDYWGKEWMNPTGSQGYGSNSIAQRIFFGILAENGMRREDFDWQAWRKAYFKLNKEQFPLFQEHQIERKRKK